MNTIQRVSELGQAIWLDYIKRSFVRDGELAQLARDGLRGVTSNPSIFEKAIAESDDYDNALKQLVSEGRSDAEIYEALVVEDIAEAADVLRPTYDATDGLDGFVSLEVDPNLADDTEGTIGEARHLFGTLKRPNILIKVPATAAGVPAIETLIGEGINVNVTLIFSLDQYEQIAQAYLRGLERRLASGGDLSHIASVASFFLSRVDTQVDQRLGELGESDLRGKAAIANAKVAYARFQALFSGDRWARLAEHGARVQRPLWASTSTKDPRYPDTMYVDALIGPHTVNTLPPATLAAFRDHGTVAATLEEDIDLAREQLRQLAALGIDMDAITARLQADGVAQFATSFQSLMDAIAAKSDRFRQQGRLVESYLGAYQSAVDNTLNRMSADHVVDRLWRMDHTLWAESPEEITNRLGWLHIAEEMQGEVERLEALAQRVRQDGIRHVVVLGMGGSSLVSEVLRSALGVADGHPELSVLDSTDPEAVHKYAEQLDAAGTLFVVATKSGSTVETLSFFRFFYNWTAERLGEEETGAHFCAITDPGSPLVELAERHQFRATFLNEPTIGGRYSALSYFGLVPAALIGADASLLLERGGNVASSGADQDLRNNPAARLGAALGALAQRGRNKLTLVTSAPLASFGHWLEQLIAESTGKQGFGIVPVVGEPLGAANCYGDDRLFVHLRLGNDSLYHNELQALADAGHPVLRINLGDHYDLGGQFWLWEMAIAIAGHVLRINPFNQPDVESSKRQAREMVERYKEKGELPQGDYAGLTAQTLDSFLGQVKAGDYIALQAFLAPTPASEALLRTLRMRLRDRLQVATTSGYGPRFLHSTGQLHKGDAGQGVFIQLTSRPSVDLPIPDAAGEQHAALTFGVLKQAQALGDAQALREVGRRLIRFDLGTDPIGPLEQLLDMVAR